MDTGATGHESQMENNSSSEENLLNAIAREIQSEIEEIKHDSQRPLIQDRIIFCVDPLIREVYEAAFRVNSVVIGRLCCYDSYFRQIEMQKSIYLDSFLKRAEKKASLNAFIKLIKDSEDRIQGCYGEICSHCSGTLYYTRRYNDDPVWFIRLVLVDASFIIELFLKAYKSERGETDFIFNTPGKMHDIRRDLFLAHNQLPFFILKDIYELAFGGNPAYPSFLHLTCHFFSLITTKTNPLRI